MIPFSPPRLDEKTVKEVTDTLLSGWITTGPKTKLFERKLEAYTESKKVLCVNSATAGMELILRWFGIQEGDEVIIPSYTYCSTANIVIHCGAKPVMVDVNENDFNINLEAIKQAITSKTKAIIPVDISGFPADNLQIMDLVKSKEIQDQFTPNNNIQSKLGRILVMNDAAHSVGARLNNAPSAKITDAAVFSFHAVKNLTTAEGGAICINLPEKKFDNEEIYKSLNTKSLHGQNKDALAKTKIGNWKYDVIEAGYKCNMTDIQAAIGLVELDRYNSETIPKRREITAYYNQLFKSYKWAKLPISETENKTSSFHLYMLRINNISEKQRDLIIEEIFKKEIAVNVHFQPLPMLSFYKGLGYKTEDYPQAFKNYSCEISLPIYYTLTNNQIEEVANTVIESVNKVIHD